MRYRPACFQKHKNGKLFLRFSRGQIVLILSLSPRFPQLPKESLCEEIGKHDSRYPPILGVAFHGAQDPYDDVKALALDGACAYAFAVQQPG